VRTHAEASPVWSARSYANGAGKTSRAFLARLIALLAVLSIAMLAPAMAQAATSYRSSSSFARTDPFMPTQVAVDDTTGDVVVADTSTVISIYGPGGSEPPIAEIVAAAEIGAIAIDQENGDLYVTEPHRISRYTTDRANPPTYTLDSSYNGPVTGAGELESIGLIAVDPTNGDLLVADANRRIVRFAPSGEFISSFNGESSFRAIIGLTVDDSGEIYVANGTGSTVENDGKSVLQRFKPDGSPDGTLPVPSPRAVTFDANSGNIVVAGDSIFDFEAFTTHPRLYVFHGEQMVTAFPLPEEMNGSNVVMLAADGVSGRIYALTQMVFGFLGVQGVQRFDPITLPDQTIDSPSAITATSMHLSGTVNPLGLDAEYHFEYTADGSNWTSTPVSDVGSGEVPVPVEADLTGLVPNTEYLVRLVSVTVEGEAITRSIAATTVLPVPATVTGPVSGVTESEATLNGTVNPFGAQATYHFEYGLTAGYGQRAPLFDGSAGAGRKALGVAVTISGLQPGTTYHYRLVTANGIGLGEGEDRTFTTPVAIPHRAYEMVSPVEKGGAAVRGFPMAEIGFEAGRDGNSFTYVTQTAFPDAESSPLESRQLATRSPGGWTSAGIDPPWLTTEPGQHGFFGTVAISPDRTHAFVVSRRRLTPGAIEGKVNLYVRNLDTGEYAFVATNAAGDFLNPGGQDAWIGGTPDFSSIAFNSWTSLSPAEPEGRYVYEWSAADGLKAASVLPDGSPIEGSSGGGNYPSAEYQLSRDGRRLYFVAGPNTVGNGGLYLNEDGQGRAISVSRVPGEPQEPQDAFFVGATADGRYAMLTVVSSVPLTGDAPAQSKDTYLYDADTDTLTYVTTLDQINAVSDDLSTIYYISDASLTPNPSGPGPYLYETHAGQTRLIAEPRVANPQPIPAGEADASPDGQYLVFVTTAKLTPYDNQAGGACGEAGCEEVYLYDAADEELACVSCRPDNGAPTGPATIGRASQSLFAHHWATAVTDDGQVFFDTPDPLVAADVNGTRDVYEYSAGQARLISGGKAPAVSAFADASADSRDVFFVTNDRLLSQDTDTLNDVYDARAGGGFAPPQAPKGECSGGDCRAASPSPAGTAAIGSETSPAAGKRPVPHKHRRCIKSKKRKAPKGCVKRHHKQHTNRRQGR
jgi:sugar lactone lactonase YvrE